MKNNLMPGSSTSASSALPKLPFRKALHDLRTARKKENAPLGIVCFHKHCHAHVPYGTHGHQAAMKANLCVKCFEQEIQTGWLKESPHCVPAKLDDACCTACVMWCKCRAPWDFATKRCTRHDTEKHGCGDVPKLQDRTEPLSLIAEYEAKMEKLIKAEQEESKQFGERQRIMNEWTDRTALGSERGNGRPIRTSRRSAGRRSAGRTSEQSHSRRRKRSRSPRKRSRSRSKDSFRRRAR